MELFKVYSIKKIWSKNSKNFSVSTSNYQIDKIIYPTIDTSQPTIGRTNGQLSPNLNA